MVAFIFLIYTILAKGP